MGEKKLFLTEDLKHGQTNALVGNIMRQMDMDDPVEAVRRVNAGEWVVVPAPRSWREQDGVIYFSVTSDGTIGPEWINRLEKKGFRVNEYAGSVLRSSDFKPTSGVTTQIAVLKGELFEDVDRVTIKIRAEADQRGLTKPNAEIVCLIREKFTDEELEEIGLWWIIVMHEPIKDSVGNPSLLGAGRLGNGRRLSAYYDRPDRKWNRVDGFAFVVS